MKIIYKLKAFLLVVLLQFILAGFDILAKAALNKGMNSYVFNVYRHAVGALFIAPFAIVLDRNRRPKMTCIIFFKILALSLLGVVGQNLYCLGMQYTTATFAAAMSNVLPALTFVIACILSLEEIKILSIRSQAKIIGTLSTVAGALIMTLVMGNRIDLPWTKGETSHQTNGVTTTKGSVMIVVGYLLWACFIILQAVTLRTYPAEVSLTALICLLGTFEGAVLALIMEKGNSVAWAIKWDAKLIASLYGGIFCTGVAYYLQGLVMKERGPVFVTAFSPLCMIIVAVLSSFILGEQMFLGRIIGAIVIVVGLYLVIWGKKNDALPDEPRNDGNEILEESKNNDDNEISEVVVSKVEAV